MSKKKRILISTIFILVLVFGGYWSIFFYKGPTLFTEKKFNNLDRRISFHNSNQYSYLYPMWNYSTGGVVSSVAISADGNYIAASSNLPDGNFYLFNTSNLANPLIWSYSAPLSQARRVAISSDGNYIAAGSAYSVFLFNKSSGTPLWSYNTTEKVSQVSISSDGNYIAATTFKGSFGDFKYGNIYLFNNSIVPLKTPMWNYSIPAISTSAALSSDGYYIAVGAQIPWDFVDGAIYLFNKSMSPDKTPMWNYQTGAIPEVAMNSNGSYIVAADAINGLVHVFENQSSHPTRNFNPGSPVYSVDVSPNGEYIVAGCEDLIYHVDHHKIYPDYWTYSSWDYNDVLFVGISDNGLDIAVEYARKNIHCFDIKQSAKILWYFGTDDLIETAEISNDGNYVVLGGYDSNVYVFNNSAPLPEDFSTSIVADDPDTDGAFNLYWSESVNADNYSIFHYDKYIEQINASLDLVEGGITEPYEFDNQYPISGIATGTHYYRIVAYNEYGYTVSYCRSVIVSLPPGDFLLTSSADDPDLDGQFNLNWDSSTDADNYSVYEHSSFITEVNYTLDLIVSGLEVNTLPREGYGNGEYYFIVAAINEISTTLSNCIKITVGQQGGDTFWEDLIQQGLLIPIVGAIAGGVVGIAFFVIKRKLQKRAEKREKNE
jgi:WD40 repeat protein